MDQTLNNVLLRDEAVGIARKFLLANGYLDERICHDPLAGEIVDTIDGIDTPAWSVFFAIDWGDPDVISNGSALVIVSAIDRSSKIHGGYSSSS